jgi:stage II sporulation protein D
VVLTLALSLALAACATGGRSAQTPQGTVAPPRVAMPEEPVPQARPSDSIVMPGLAGAVTVRIRITDDQGTRVVTLPLDEYVVGAVRAELPPKALQNDVLSRLLQVQAVVSRTYALANIHRHNAEGFDLCDSTHCQLYRARLAAETDTDPAARAVAATRGQVITFGGRVIQALFHSSCGGHTTSAGAVWGGTDMPYLRPVPDWFCARPASVTNWEFSTDEASLRRALNSDTRTAVGSRLGRIDIIQRDVSGRAELVTLSGARAPVVRAEELRSVLRRVFGQRSIRSTWFTVSRRGDQFVFTGVGYGHGVGLCQTGASQRAQSGQPAVDIIAHYFPGTRLQAASLALVGPVPTDQHFGH